jgi:hypothetical protein
VSGRGTPSTSGAADGASSASAGASVSRVVNVFVAARGNAFMTDIATGIVDAARELGRDARLVTDRLPQPDGSINLVVAPHEFFLLPPAASGQHSDAAPHGVVSDAVPHGVVSDAALHGVVSDADVVAAGACSIPVCTEQPGTPWFYMSLGFAQFSPLLVDINAAGTAALGALGYQVERLRLGATRTMSRAQRPHAARGPGAETHRPAAPRAGAIPRGLEPERDIDVLFLGGLTDARAAALAHLAPVLWNRHSDLRLFRFTRPVTGEEPGLVFGDAKLDLLRRAKVLVNVHRDEGSDGYFEWARMVEAMATGCVVVTEPSTDHEPLVAGTHFVAAPLDGLADALVDVLDDDERRSAIAIAAHDAVTGAGSLASQLAPVLAAAERALFPASGDHPVARRPTPHRPTRVPIQRVHRGPLLPEFRPFAALRTRLYHAIHGEIEHRREIGRLRCTLRHGSPDHVDRHATPAWDSTDAPPRLSVIVTLHDYADVVTETLDSVVAAIGARDDAEIVVVDDASTDHGRHVVVEFMATHAATPMLLLGADANRGLPAARNLAVEASRGAYVMVMDADNLLYPTCLIRLEAALDADPQAAFAYATLEAFGAEPGLRSALGWYVPWLTDGNYIDAQAMVRRSTFARHGGYRTGDPLVYGWEDWELWLRLAAAGEYGVHVPEMLGRYRTQSTSMISVSNLAADAMHDHLRSLYPDLPWSG